MTNLRPILFLFPLVATACFAQCNPHPFHPNMLPPCPTIADQLSQAFGAAQEFKKDVAIINQQTTDARTRYWKLFPNGPGIGAAEAAYYGALQQKDLYYLMFALPDGVTGRTAMMANAIEVTADPLGMDPSTPRDIKKFPTNVDGGIRPYAFPVFVAWVNALRRSEGRETDGMMATPMIIATAVKDKSNFRRAYEQSRDWAEFESSGLDISKYITPQAYILNQMESDVSLVLARSKPADIPDAALATRELYNQFVKAFGEKEVQAAATKVLHTPKNSMGGLAKRAEVVIGTFVGSPSPDPFLLFLTELTNSTSRTYAVALCMDRNNLLGGEATATFNSKEHWEKALSMYSQVVAKYGEANVLAAAGRLKDVPKDANGIRGDTQSKGIIMWFQALLKDPKTPLPEAGIFRASSYDPHWMGQVVQVRGTVSHVDLDKGKFPPYATIHFKESNGDRLTVFTPNSDMWQGSFGEAFAGLIGKPIEVYGQVNEWRQGAGVRVLTSDQLKVIDAAALANIHESHPAWLTAPIPTQVLVDTPEYVGWKKYSPGTKVGIEYRLLMEHQPGTNQFTRNKISHYTFQLESIDNERAVVSIDTTTWHMSGGQTQSTDKLTYKAKVPPTPPSDDRQVTTGEETLTINGKEIACKWEKVALNRDPVESFTKTWRSDKVPGGLVLMQVHQRSMATGPRSITETIYAPVDGVTPELGSGNSAAPAPAAPAAQPAEKDRTANTAQPVNSASPNAAETAARQGGKGAAVGRAPAPFRPPTIPSVVTGRGGLPVTQPQSAGAQVEINQRYGAAMMRVSRARMGLAQFQRARTGTPAPLPDDVVAARDRLNTQQRAIAIAMRSRDDATEQKSFQDLEDTLTVIEKFLAK